MYLGTLLERVPSARARLLLYAAYCLPPRQRPRPTYRRIFYITFSVSANHLSDPPTFPPPRNSPAGLSWTHFPMGCVRLHQTGISRHAPLIAIASLSALLTPSSCIDVLTCLTDESAPHRRRRIAVASPVVATANKAGTYKQNVAALRRARLWTMPWLRQPPPGARAERRRLWAMWPPGQPP